MAILDMEGNVVSDPFPIVGRIPAPSAGDTAWTAVQQAGLGTIGQLAAIPRIIGDLFNAPSLSQWGRDVNLNAKQAAEELTPLGEGSVQRILREATVNTAQSIPAMVSGGLIPALTIMGGQSYLDGYSQARDGGLSVGRSHIFAGIDAIFETATEAWSLPVLFKSNLGIVRRANEFLMKELAGEEITTIGQSMNQWLQLNPEMTLGEYAAKLKQEMLQTALVTPPTALMQMGVARGAQFLRRTSSGLPLQVEGDVPNPAGGPSTPVPSEPTVALPTPKPPFSSNQQQWLPEVGAPTKEDYKNYVPTPVQLPDREPAPQGQQMPLPFEGAPVPEPPPNVMHTPEGEKVPEAQTPQPIPVTKEDAEVLTVVAVPEYGPQLPADVAPTMKQVDPPTLEVPNNYKDFTPEALAAMPQPDLRLYQGVATDGYAAMVVSYDPTYTEPATGQVGAWKVVTTYDSATAAGKAKPVPGAVSVFSNYAEAREYLERRTKQPMTEEFIKKQHQLLSIRDAVSLDGHVTPKQLEVYGEQLGRVADKAKLVRSSMGYTPSGFAWLSWNEHLRGPDYPMDTREPPKVAVEYTDPVMGNKVSKVVRIQDQAPGTYLKDSPETRLNPHIKKLQTLVESWRVKYGINAPIILETFAGQSPIEGYMNHYSKTGGSNFTEGVVYKISTERSGTLEQQIMVLAHEFGHVIGYDTVLNAPPQTAIKLVETWLDMVQEYSGTQQRNEDMVNAGGGVTRALVYEGLHRSPEGKSNKYSLQFHEFMADQVAQHLYENQYHSPHDADVKGVLTKLLARLEQFFRGVLTKFQPKLQFREYLDQLAGFQPIQTTTPVPEEKKPPKKAKAKTAKATKTVVEKTSKGAKVKHKVATPAEKSQLSKFDPEAVKERAWLVGLMKKHGMWDDITREEVDPKGSVEDFNFDKAKELLDAIGVGWETGINSSVYIEPKFKVGDIVTMQNPARAAETKYPPMGKVIAIDTEKDLVTIRGDDGEIVTRKTRYVRDAVEQIRNNTSKGYPQYRPHVQQVDLELNASEPRRVDEPDTWEFRNALSMAIPKLAGTDETLRNKLADSALSIRNFGRLWRSTLTALQIRKIYGASVPGVKHFVDGLQAMSAYANKIRKRAEEGLELMRTTGEKQRNKVFELMIKESETGKFLNTPQDFMSGGLNESGIKLYNTLREDYRYALNTMENLAQKALLEDLGVQVGPNDTLLNSNDGTPLSPEKTATLKAEQKKIAEAFAKMAAKPYYPHTRFGDYYAVARMEDGKTLAFTQGQTLEEVRRYAKALAGDGVTTWYGEMPEAVKPFVNMPYQVFDMLKSQLNLTPKQMADFEDILKNLAPEQSFIRKFKTRRDITGWENNPDQGPQVYAEYFSKFANYAARRWHSAALDNAIKETKAFKKDIFGEDEANNVVLIDRLTNWMAETKEYAMRPDIAAANIRAAVTLWYLGAVPKSAIINAASVPLMTLPWLGKRYGDLKAAAALKQAYMDIGKMFKRAESLSPDERELLNYLEEIGVADQSYASTMAAVTEGGKLMEATMLGKGSLKAHAYNLKWFAMWGFHKVEVMNRLVTGMAAYRLAKAQMGYTGEALNKEAAEIAKDAIQDTQNENLQWNRPELMRGKKSLLTLFMSYTQNAMFQMYGGDQSWQRMLALQLMIAGLLGLPLAKNMDDVIQWFAKEVFGTKASAETALRDFLKGTIINPDWVLKGASYNFLNTGVNLQGSLSMGNLIPGIDALVLEGTFPERLANAASDVGGAGAAVVLSFMQAMADNNPDSMKAWSRTMPTAIKNAYDGYKMMTSGVVTDSTNDAIMRVSGAEGTAKVLGFQSTNVTQTREKLFQQKQMVQYWMTRRKMIFDMFELAEKQGDVSTELAAEKALDQFNDDVPDSALAIRKKDLANAMRKREKNAEKKEEGLPLSKKNAGLYEQVGSRYSAQ